jgi:hypothetical protein
VTPREEMSHLHSVIADAHARLAVLYLEVAAAPPRIHQPPPAAPRGPSGYPIGSPADELERERMEHDEPPNVNAAPPPCPLKNGGALYGWAKDHDLVKRVSTLGKAWDYPGKITEYDPDQVAAVYHEIASKAPPGAYPVQQRRGVR